MITDIHTHTKEHDVTLLIIRKKRKEKKKKTQWSTNSKDWLLSDCKKKILHIDKRSKASVPASLSST